MNTDLNLSYVTNSFFFKEILLSLSKYCLFVAILAGSLLIIRYFTKINDNVFRKLLHLVAFFSPIFIVLNSSNWLVADLVILIFIIVVYFILLIAEKWKGFSYLLTEKEPGEIKKSFIEFFGISGILIFITWGIFSRIELFITAILMWGFGDAAAALMGKRFGRKKLNFKLADPNKTVVGSVSMFVVSSIIGIIMLTVVFHKPEIWALWSSIITSVLGTLTEAVSYHGNDTVTDPIIITLSLLLLSFF